jgi:hypothetical protein
MSFVIGLVILNCLIAAGINTHIIKTDEISSGGIEPCGDQYIPTIGTFRLTVQFGGNLELELDDEYYDIKNWSNTSQTVKILFNITNIYEYSGAKTVYWRIGEWQQLNLPGSILPMIIFFLTQGNLKTLEPFNKDNKPLGFMTYKMEYEPYTNATWYEYVDIEFSPKKDYYDLTMFLWEGLGSGLHFSWSSLKVFFN